MVQSAGRVRAVVAVGVVVALALLVLVSYFAVAALAPTAAGPSATASPTPTAINPEGGGVPVEQHDAEPDPLPGGEGTTPPFITGTTVADDGLSIVVYSFVPGLTEQNGTCRAIVTGDGEPRVAEAPATVEVSETTCMPITVQLSGASVPLKVTVEYRSDTSSGVSKEVGVRRG